MQAFAPIGFPTTAIQLATTPGDVLYTQGGGSGMIVDMSFKNTTTSDATVTAYLVRSGGSIGVTYELMFAASVPKRATAPNGVPATPFIGKVLNAGDFIQVFASAGATITPMGSVQPYA